MGSILSKEWVVVSKVLQHFCSYQSEGWFEFLIDTCFCNFFTSFFSCDFEMVIIFLTSPIWWKNDKRSDSFLQAQLLYKRMQDDGFVDRCSFASSLTSNILLLDLHCASQIRPSLFNNVLSRSGRSNEWIWKDVSLSTIINLLFMALVSGIYAELHDYMKLYEDTLTLWLSTMVYCCT